MDVHEREYIAAVINYFWGPNLTSAQGVNESAALIAYGALEKANLCSTAMNYVPRPTLVADPKYAIKQLVEIGKRIISNNTGIYVVCKNAIGAGYKSAIRIALMGA